MIPYLLITKDEFVKILTFQYSWKRYLAALSLYSLVGVFIYFSDLVLTQIRIVSFYNVNLFAFIILFLLISRGILIKLPDIEGKVLDEEFRSQISVLIACHNSEDVLPHTLEAAIKHFPPEAIYIADNNKVEPEENKSKKICEEYGVNYVFTKVSNKTLALRNTIKYVDEKYTYVISMDDDTLFPEKFYLDKDTFADKRMGCIAFSIRVKKKETLIERSVDMELKLFGYNNFGRNFGSVDFGIGVAYMMPTKLFKSCIDHNPGDGRVPYGEDGYQGVMTRQNGYYLQQDMNNFFLTYCPDKLLDFSFDRKAISGYDAGSLHKQRILRWYRTGTARIILEFSTIFTTNIRRSDDGFCMSLMRNIYYRIWKLFEGFMLLVLLIYPFMIYKNISSPEDLKTMAIIIGMWPITMMVNLTCLKIKFRNSEDLYIDTCMIFIYPIYLKLKFIMNVLGFIGCFTYFVPFVLYPGFFYIGNYTFPVEEPEQEEVDIELGNFTLEKVVVQP